MARSIPLWLRNLLTLFLLLLVSIGAAVPARSQTSEQVTGIVASLVDPQKLATLDPQHRSVNERYKKLLYWLWVGEQRGSPLETVLSTALDSHGVSAPRRELTLRILRVNLDRANRAGLFESEANQRALRSGYAATILLGPWTGEQIEVDHIVPLALYPQFANDLANLQILPESLNRSKGDRMGDAEQAHLRKLTEIVTAENELARQALSALAEVQARQAKLNQAAEVLSRDYNFALPPRWSRIGNQLLFNEKIISANIPAEARQAGLKEDEFILRRAIAARTEAFSLDSKSQLQIKFLSDQRLRGWNEDERAELYQRVFGRSLADDLVRERALPR